MNKQTTIRPPLIRQANAIYITRKSLNSASKCEEHSCYFFHFVGAKYSSLRRGKLWLFGVYNILQTPRTHRCRSFFQKNTTSFCGSH